MRRSLFGKRFGRKTGFIAMATMMVVGIALIGWLVMLLWNWLMPGLIPGAGQLDYWRALGLLLLCKLLFGGGRGGHRWHERAHQWERMTPEERTQFKERFQSRWGDRFGGDWRGCPPPRSPNPASGDDAAVGTNPQDPTRSAS